MGALRNILLLIIPFLLIIIINEVSRPNIQGKPYKIFATAMNSVAKDMTRCTWMCHNEYESDYCKNYHVKYLKNYFSYTDDIYNGIINLLKGGTNSTYFYQITNVVFLVFLIPLIIWYLLTKSLSMQDQIRKLKRK
jgi:hypothetical protein